MATVQELLYPPISGDLGKGGILGSYVRWEEGPADHALRYSFTLDAQSASSPSNQPFNEMEKAAARLVLTEVAAITGIEFIEIADGDAAQLTFLNEDYPGAYFSTRSDMAVGDHLEVTHYVPKGSVVIGTNSGNAFTDPYAGNGSLYQLLMHEIGHAMNLKHPHDGWVMLDPAVDNNLHTVMTYQGGVGSRVDYPDYDVAALQWRYGTDGLGGEGAWTYGATNLFGTIELADRLEGTSRAEILYGNAGDDTLIGRGGNDILVGGGDIDRLNGGAGDDTYVLLPGSTIVDSAGIDTVYVNGGTWKLQDGLENLRLNGPLSPTDSKLTGNAADNLLTADAGANVLKGMDGNDALWGRDGDDTLIGGRGDDLLVGGNYGTDVLTGGSGHDRFFFSQPPIGTIDQITDFRTGVDELHFDGDTIFGLGTSGRFALDDPRFYAAPGATGAHDADDRIIFNTATGQLFWDSDGTGSVTPAYQIATLQGGAGLVATDLWLDRDPAPGVLVLGSAGIDTLFGGEGNDRLDGMAGADSMNGGGGNDSYVVTTGDVLADTGGVDWVYSSAATWQLGDGFENLALLAGSTAETGLGNSLDNRIVGNQLANTLKGNGGNDDLLGGGGADQLRGGGGHDQLQGGSGNDRFIFSNAGGGDDDTIADFGNGADSLRLSEAAFAEIGATGRLAADDARFYAAAGATGGHDATDRIVYDTASGRLYYDADGSGDGAAQLVATLEGHPALAATQVYVF